jgi:WD40 repeat protein
VPTIFGGFEDSSIKSIDLRIESVTNSIQAHNDSITSLNILNDIYLFSTSHDTKIKMWDVRYLNTPVCEAIGSQKKWDEAMWHSCLIPNSLMLATGKHF